MSLKNLTAVIIFVSFSFFGSPLSAEELHIYFKTSPRPEQLRPFSDPANMSLLITATDGRPVEEGTVEIRLDAPKPGRFFSTDVPLVEGTRLTEMRLPLRRGRADWKQLFPIRGEYRLAVVVSTNDGKTASQTFSFKLRENRQKWLALGGFSAGLFLLGFAAGRIFTGKRASAALGIAAALVMGSARISAAQVLQKQVSSAALKIEPATVGTPSLVRWSMDGADVSEKRRVALTLTITHLELQKIVFAVEKLPVAGEFSMKFHFTDGAEYRVAAVGDVPGLAPIRNEQIILVTGIEPPARAIIPALSFFLATIALGLAAGRWSKRRTAAP